MIVAVTTIYGGRDGGAGMTSVVMSVRGFAFPTFWNICDDKPT